MKYQKQFNIMKLKKYLFIAAGTGTLIIAGLILIAFSRTWGKTDIEFKIHINETLIQQSTFGESPTFAIWLESPENQVAQTVFVTKRAALGDWEGKAEVPVALPKWFEVYKVENQSDELPTFEKPAPLAITGATPRPGYFSTRVRVTPGSKWICYIEVNLAGDFNENFQQYSEEKKTSDEYLTGQPALLYRAEITADEDKQAIPKVVGMCILNSNGDVDIQPLEGITTATDIFDEMTISVVKPKPRIIEKKN
jgi:hypothetical protein